MSVNKKMMKPIGKEYGKRHEEESCNKNKKKGRK